MIIKRILEKEAIITKEKISNREMKVRDMKEKIRDHPINKIKRELLMKKEEKILEEYKEMIQKLWIKNLCLKLQDNELASIKDKSLKHNKKILTKYLKNLIFKEMNLKLSKVVLKLIE